MDTRFIDRRYPKLAVLAAAVLPFLLFQVGTAHAQFSIAPAASASQSASPSAALKTESATAPFRSAMQGYKPYTDEKTVDWKQANDSTGKIGGWREYAKEAQQPDAAADSARSAPDARPIKP